MASLNWIRNLYLYDPMAQVVNAVALLKIPESAIGSNFLPSPSNFCVTFEKF